MEALSSGALEARGMLWAWGCGGVDLEFERYVVSLEAAGNGSVVLFMFPTCKRRTTTHWIQFRRLRILFGSLRDVEACCRRTDVDA